MFDTVGNTNPNTKVTLTNSRAHTAKNDNEPGENTFRIRTVYTDGLFLESGIITIKLYICSNLNLMFSWAPPVQMTYKVGDTKNSTIFLAPEVSDISYTYSGSASKAEIISACPITEYEIYDVKRGDSTGEENFDAQAASLMSGVLSRNVSIMNTTEIGPLNPGVYQ